MYKVFDTMANMKKIELKNFFLFFNFKLKYLHFERDFFIQINLFFFSSFLTIEKCNQYPLEQLVCTCFIEFKIYPF